MMCESSLLFVPNHLRFEQEENSSAYLVSFLKEKASSIVNM